MLDSHRATTRGRVGGALALGALAASTVLAAGAMSFSAPAWAVTDTVDLGTVDSFSVLGGSTVTNVPSSSLGGDLGLSPAAGSYITGFGDCSQVDGTIYTVDASGPACRENNPGLLTLARAHGAAAYADASSRLPDQTFADGDNQLGLVGEPLTAGVYRFGAAPTANLTGQLVLHGDASSVWIFQATSTLVTASDSSILLTGGARACNVFWQVASSATLGSGSTFVGTIMAAASIGVNSGVTVQGRALAGQAVTLDQDVFTHTSCASATTTSSTSSSSSTTSTSSTSTTSSTSPTSTSTTSTTSPTGTSTTSSSATTSTGPATSTATSPATSTATSTRTTAAAGPRNPGPPGTRRTTPAGSSRLAETGVSPALVPMTALALLLLVVGGLLMAGGRARVRIRRH